MTPAQYARTRSRHEDFPYPWPGKFFGNGHAFDHAATFELKGIPGNIVQGVINISSDGTFLAIAIGYGFKKTAPVQTISCHDRSFRQ